MGYAVCVCVWREGVAHNGNKKKSFFFFKLQICYVCVFKQRVECVTTFNEEVGPALIYSVQTILIKEIARIIVYIKRCRCVCVAHWGQSLFKETFLAF